MFLTIVLLIWSSLNVYVFWRLTSIPVIARNIPGKYLVIAAVVLWASFPLALFLNHQKSAVFAGLFEMIGVNWLGILFLLFSSLLVVDVVTGFGFLFPRIAPNLRGLALLIGIILVAIAYIQGLRPPVVNDYDLNPAHLPENADGLVIVAISDMHTGTMPGENWLLAIANRVNALNPDLIVMVGDLIEGNNHGDSRQGIQSALGRFSAPLGVWAVTGNHERYHGLESNVRLIGEAGIKILHDEWHEIMPGLILAGIDDTSDRSETAGTANRIRRALAGRPENSTTVLLSHRPHGMEAAADAGVELMLCAHTHGGQIWPFDYIVRIMNPMLEGWYEVKGMPVLVSRGTGTWGPRMRLWSPGEIVRITLHAQ